MGDMLYMDRGKEPRRVHGAYVSESEIEKVVDFVKQQARPAYDLSITTRADASDDDDGEDKFVDPLYDKALSIVAEKGKVSTSMIQRHLSVGYNRAAKLVDAMETEGVIGPPNGSKPREVYISAA
jgi:S-DNA-T family DNA segregation ATPase FtsK/SpoIIIE